MSKYVKHQHSKRFGYLEYRREISDVSYHFKYSGKMLSRCLANSINEWNVRLELERATKSSQRTKTI